MALGHPLYGQRICNHCGYLFFLCKWLEQLRFNNMCSAKRVTFVESGKERSLLEIMSVLKFVETNTKSLLSSPSALKHFSPVTSYQLSSIVNQMLPSILSSFYNSL